MDSTCWTSLKDAAAGGREARDRFAERYAPMVRAYLAARWRGSAIAQEVDDAAQEVCGEGLRGGGGVDHARAGRPGGSRAFLSGVARNVALRFERPRARRRERPADEGPEPDRIAADEEAFSRVFDRA